MIRCYCAQELVCLLTVCVIERSCFFLSLSIFASFLCYLERPIRSFHCGHQGTNEKGGFLTMEAAKQLLQQLHLRSSLLSRQVFTDNVEQSRSYKNRREDSKNLFKVQKVQPSCLRPLNNYVRV